MTRGQCGEQTGEHWRPTSAVLHRFPPRLCLRKSLVVHDAASDHELPKLNVAGSIPVSRSMSYLTRWRLQLGAQMLVSTSYTVAQIASEVGYESEPDFNRAFKRCLPLVSEHTRNQCGRAARPHRNLIVPRNTMEFPRRNVAGSITCDCEESWVISDILPECNSDGVASHNSS